MLTSIDGGKPAPVYERCEWAPGRDQAASVPEVPGDCHAGAKLSVGKDPDNWHLCESCAALPRFARKRHRVPLKGRLDERGGSFAVFRLTGQMNVTGPMLWPKAEVTK